MSYKTLFQKTYDLVKWIYPTVSKFPRSQKTVLSQRIELTSIRLLEMVIDFSEKDTKIYRKKILHEVHKLQILFRLCKDLSILKFRQYEYASSLLAEISSLLKIEDVEPPKLGGGTWRWFTEICTMNYALSETWILPLEKQDRTNEAKDLYRNLNSTWNEIYFKSNTN